MGHDPLCPHRGRTSIIGTSCGYCALIAEVRADLRVRVEVLRDVEMPNLDIGYQRARRVALMQVLDLIDGSNDE
jgi:hypothetical protein